MPEPKDGTPPASTPPATPTPTTTDSLITQYDIGDAAPVATAPMVPVAESVTPPATESGTLTTPPRGPDGKFAKRAHPARLTKMAGDLGISEEEIAEYSTAELREMVRDSQMEHLLSRREASIEAALSRPDPLAGPVPADSELPPPAAPAAGDGDLGFDWGQDDDGRKLSAKDYAPGLVNIVRQLKTRIDQLEGHARASVQETVAGKLDQAFDRLGADYKPHIGEGKGGELAGDSLELTVRHAIIKKAASLAKSSHPDRVAAKIGQAAKELLGSKLKAAPTPPPPEPTQDDSATEEWLQGGLARPTHREGAPELKGRQAAERTVAEWQRRNGSAAGPGIAADEFPG